MSGRTTPPEAPLGRFFAPVVLTIWLVAALAAGAAGVVSRLQPPAPQIVLVALTAATLIAVATIPAASAWVASLSLERLVGLHLTRFVGFAFLALYAKGELPRAFALPCGWGDVATASGAAVLLLAFRPLDRRWGLIAGWNLFGLADILFVVVTAARLAMADATSMAPLLRLPLSLLPTFLVPLIIASHAIVFARWRRRSSPAD